MKTGVFTNKRVKLLLPKGSVGCRGFHMRKGEKCRKSVRGCIISPEISVLNLMIVKKGETANDFDVKKDEKFLYPKRSGKLRGFFSINKGDDVRKFLLNEKNNSEKKKIKNTKNSKISNSTNTTKKTLYSCIKKKKIIGSKK